MDNPTKELCHKLDEMGVEYDTYDLPNGKCGVSWIDGNNIEWEAVQLGENFEIHALQLVTPEQAIAATVGRRDTMGLWYEWEQVLFANVSDEVAQDNLNECVHELLDKAATMGERNPDGLPIGLTVSNDGNLLNWVGENYVRQNAATVGAGTCHVKAAKKLGDSFGFSLSCGHSMVNQFDDRPDYCPWCGARVVDE